MGKVYDMSNKDYEKYVLSDVVHVGWKGWVYIVKLKTYEQSSNSILNSKKTPYSD